MLTCVSNNCSLVITSPVKIYWRFNWAHLWSSHWHWARLLHWVKAEAKKIERAMSSEFQNFISTNLHTSRISLQLIWNNCWIIPMVRGQIKVRPASFAKRFLIPNVKICGNEILKFRWHCPLNLFCFSFDSVFCHSAQCQCELI